LIHSKGFLPELESVVRDLWALRLQIIKHQDKEAPEDTDTEFQQLFSSQAEVSEEDDGSAREMKKREKNLPTLIDSLSLCYLGMVVLRIPVSLGDLHKYALEGSSSGATADSYQDGRSKKRYLTSSLCALSLNK